MQDDPQEIHLNYVRVSNGVRYSTIDTRFNTRSWVHGQSSRFLLQVIYEDGRHRLELLDTFTRNVRLIGSVPPLYKQTLICTTGRFFVQLQPENKQGRFQLSWRDVEAARPVRRSLLVDKPRDFEPCFMIPTDQPQIILLFFHSRHHGEERHRSEDFFRREVFRDVLSVVKIQRINLETRSAELLGSVDHPALCQYYASRQVLVHKGKLLLVVPGGRKGYITSGIYTVDLNEKPAVEAGRNPHLTLTPLSTNKIGAFCPPLGMTVENDRLFMLGRAKLGDFDFYYKLYVYDLSTNTYSLWIFPLDRDETFKSFGIQHGILTIHAEKRERSTDDWYPQYSIRYAMNNPETLARFAFFARPEGAIVPPSQVPS